MRVGSGILSNFPIWLFDSKGKPEWPTFGFKLIEPGSDQPMQIDNSIEFAKAIITTMMDAHDKMHVENEDFERTIAIPTLGVRTTEFDLSTERRDALYKSGVRAAQDFFKSWDFNSYVRKHRMRRDPKYVKKITKLRKTIVA